MRSMWKFLAAGALFGAVTILHADDSAAPVPSGNVTVSTRLTIAEMQANAQILQDQVQEHYRLVLRIQEKVREAKDVIKLNCVNDKLVQMKAQMNILDSANRQLQDALTKNSDERHSSYSQLERAANSVRVLHEEANTCVGEQELVKGEHEVEVTHPDFPDDPLADNPWDDSPADAQIEPPAYASLFF